MLDSIEFWELFWESRLRELENQGKREAILAASRLLRDLYRQTGKPARILELGCGEGQIIGALLRAHPELCDRRGVVGVDANPLALARCRRDFPGLRFIEGDFTDAGLLAGLGTYDVVLLVNAVHEVFSSTLNAETGEVDAPRAKQRVTGALAGAARLLAPGGWLALFDGVEPPGSPDDRLRIRFHRILDRRNFDLFVEEYRPFRITAYETGDRLCVELSRRDFARYMTKSIFLGKPLWERERHESYQYFSEGEFRAVFLSNDLEVVQLSMIRENEERWRQMVHIETPGEEFPLEHILILGRFKPRERESCS